MWQSLKNLGRVDSARLNPACSALLIARLPSESSLALPPPLSGPSARLLPGPGPAQAATAARRPPAIAKRRRSAARRWAGAGCTNTGMRPFSGPGPARAARAGGGRRSSRASAAASAAEYYYYRRRSSLSFRYGNHGTIITVQSRASAAAGAADCYLLLR